MKTNPFTEEVNCSLKNDCVAIINQLVSKDPQVQNVWLRKFITEGLYAVLQDQPSSLFLSYQETLADFCQQHHWEIIAFYKRHQEEITALVDQLREQNDCSMDQLFPHWDYQPEHVTINITQLAVFAFQQVAQQLLIERQALYA